jgi:hypothetical protein
MFSGIVPDPSRRRKDTQRRIGTKHVEKAERAQVDVSILINGSGKADRSWSNGILHVILQLSRGKFGDVDSQHILLFKSPENIVLNFRKDDIFRAYEIP